MNSVNKNSLFCQECQASNARFKCAGCHQVHYCSTACQRKNWPSHKKRFSQMRKGSPSSAQRTNCPNSLLPPQQPSSLMATDNAERRPLPSKLPKDLKDFVMGDGIDDSISSDIEIPSSDNSDQEQVLGYDPNDSQFQ